MYKIGDRVKLLKSFSDYAVVIDKAANAVGAICTVVEIDSLGCTVVETSDKNRWALENNQLARVEPDTPSWVNTDPKIMEYLISINDKLDKILNKK